MINTSFIALAVATVMGLGLLATLAGASLLTGAVQFLLLKPKLKVLKSKIGESGFAFSYEWNSVQEPADFYQVKVRLYNPFGKPTQIEATKSFAVKDQSFALDIDLGTSFVNLRRAKGIDKATIQVELLSKDGIVQQFPMKALKFISVINSAEVFAADYEGKLAPSEKAKVYFETHEKTFIADAFSKASDRVLVLPNNPLFATQFAGAGGSAKDAGAGAAAAVNFSISKVWIDPGCIVCDACETIYPEVFEVKADTCIIKPGSPLNDGLRIQEAAEACPVEVIKFTKIA